MSDTDQQSTSMLRPSMDAAPKPSYDELVMRVSELAAANVMLQAKADRDGLVLESATDFAIISLNLAGQIKGWNPGAERLLGHTRDEALGCSGAILFTPEDRAAGVFIAELWNAFEHGSARNERWHLRRDGSRFWASGTMMPLLDGTGMIGGFLNIMRDGTTALEAERHHEFLLAEARHKSKNTFATVQAVAARHFGMDRGTDDPLMVRLAALARSHDLLELGEVLLAEVVGRSLAPYGAAPGHAHAAGPPVVLSGGAAAALNSVLHELATNAAKYGAFSVPGGAVEVTWTVEAAGERGPSAARPDILLLWHERGGPPVVPPSRRGFGTRVIEGQLVREGGTAELSFQEQGVTCRIRLPAAWGPTSPQGLHS